MVFDDSNETDKGDTTVKTLTIPPRHVAVSKPAEVVLSHVTCPRRPPSLWAGIISEVF